VFQKESAEKEEGRDPALLDENDAHSQVRHQTFFSWVLGIITSIFGSKVNLCSYVNIITVRRCSLTFIFI
jgi:hypothetical protein